MSDNLDPRMEPLIFSLSSGPVLRHLNESSITSTEINL